jgi:hypothetical protein
MYICEALVVVCAIKILTGTQFFYSKLGYWLLYIEIFLGRYRLSKVSTFLEVLALWESTKPIVEIDNA